MPLVRRLPKRGFYSRNRKRHQAVNVGSLAALGDGAEVTPETLAANGLISATRGSVKLLGEGDAPRDLKVRVHALSAAARSKIEAAGGAVETIA
jgi:large subunit ribosomal protein L15